MWRRIMTLENEPAAAVLSRQNLPTLGSTVTGDGLHKGAYIIAGSIDEKKPDVILMASGSEVHLMLEAHNRLEKEGIKVRSLSVPCFGLFKQQSDEYIQSLLPSSV